MCKLGTMFHRKGLIRHSAISILNIVKRWTVYIYHLLGSLFYDFRRLLSATLKLLGSNINCGFVLRILLILPVLPVFVVKNI